MIDAAFFQFTAHDASERTDARFGKVGDFEPRGVKLVACAHRADERDTHLVRAYGKVYLRRYGVDGINEIVCLTCPHHQFVYCFGRVKEAHCLHDCFGRDVGDTRFHRIDLVLTDGRAERVYLPIDVRQTDRFGIDENNPADTCTRQAFDRI